MKQEQEVLLELMKYELWGKFDSQKVQYANWYDVLEEAEYHKVWCLLYDAMARLKAAPTVCVQIDERLLGELRIRSYTAVVNFYETVKLQKEVVNEIEAQGLRAAILKGLPLSANYPEPSFRSSRDLDIYALPEDFDKIRTILEDKGFQNRGTHTGYHTEYFRNDREVELHNAPAGLPLGNTRGKLKFIKDMPNRTHRGDEQFGNIYEPDILDNAIVQLLHILHHTKEQGLKVRMIMDWELFINKYVDDSVWHEKFEKPLEAAGLDRMAKILTKISKVYLGLDNPDITWCDDMSMQDITPFWEYLMAHGSFDTGLKRPKMKQTELRTDEWEYHGAEDGAYGLKLVGRNIKDILTGRKSLGVAVYNYRSRRRCRKFLLGLGIIDRKFVKDYAFLS